MADRRPLTEGLKPPAPSVDRDLERQFVYGSKAPATADEAAPAEKQVTTIARAPITTRVRADYAAALKRASLERQLSGELPNTLQEILEEALGPWLKAHGYVP